VFTRFTEPARNAVVLAQDEARRLGHEYIGTEHLLLGLAGEGRGLAASVLGSLGVTPDGARARVEAVVGRGEGMPAGQIPFTPEAKKSLEGALHEAQELGHEYIGTEHLLLGLADAGDETVAARVLADLGVNVDGVHAEVLRALGGVE